MAFRIIFRWTSQSLSNGCIVGQPNLDRLDIDVVDHRGLLVNIHGIKFCFRFIVDVAVHHAQSSCYHGRTDRRDIVVAVLRTSIPGLRQTWYPYSSLLDFLIIHAFCMFCCYRIMMPIHNPSYTPFPFNGGGGVVKAQIIILQFLCRAFKFVYSSLSSHEKECSTIKPRGVDSGPGSPMERQHSSFYIPR